jgi:hypothetical protein
MAAAYALLGIGAAAAEAADKPSEPAAPARTSLDTSFLYYNESSRITVLEPQIFVRRDYGDNRALNILVSVDTISGASPLGTLPATANTAPNTITNASGHLVSPVVGRTPTQEFNDTRVGTSVSLEKPWSSVSSTVMGLSAGKERDFLSLGANFLYNHDFNQKNTTFSFGVSPEFDRVTPNGGLPMSYGTLGAPGVVEDKSDYKYLVSGLAGITQVISKQLLMQWNYGLTFEHGYLNDPYKLLSIVNANGDPVSTLYEQRPNHRMEHSLFWLIRYSLRRADVFSLGFRYFGDDWGIRSHTLDFTYRWQYHERRYLEPHVRYYHQLKSDFYHIGLQNDRPLPTFASADYRLADIDAVTFGVRCGFTFKNESRLVLRAEYYTQTGESKPSDAVGAQRAFDLFPTLNATILQIDYHFEPATLFHRKAR